jgi:hypothetical protein
MEDSYTRKEKLIIEKGGIHIRVTATKNIPDTFRHLLRHRSNREHEWFEKWQVMVMTST